MFFGKKERRLYMGLLPASFTTGKQDFATLHLAKASPSAALGEGHLAKILSVKPSSPSAKFQALGEAFAKCQSPT